MISYLDSLWITANKLNVTHWYQVSMIFFIILKHIVAIYHPSSVILNGESGQ